MIVFLQTDSRFPFLWESTQQPEARYNAAGDGPVQYFADTCDGAWAEFVRHAEITDVEELSDVRRALWCIEVDDAQFEESTPVDLSYEIATGNRTTCETCWNYARSLRDRGILRIKAPSAAIKRQEAGGFRVQEGIKPGQPRDGYIFVVFDIMPNITGWKAAEAGPPEHVLAKTRHF
ncbi:MAG: hypothetical protein SFV17_18335 [Candidatus Obscuribacter sp.]|nr:hypothetical protein [Candidatus Obscuribacter sp.]